MPRIVQRCSLTWVLRALVWALQEARTHTRRSCCDFQYRPRRHCCKTGTWSFTSISNKITYQNARKAVCDLHTYEFEGWIAWHDIEGCNCERLLKGDVWCERVPNLVHANCKRSIHTIRWGSKQRRLGWVRKQASEYRKEKLRCHKRWAIGTQRHKQSLWTLLLIRTNRGIIGIIA